MAKHKKKRAHKTSKGERASISKSNIRLVRQARSEGDKYIAKLAAWRAGKNGYVTIANPNPHETDKPFIKVSFNKHFGHGRDFKSLKMGDNGSNSKADTTL